MNTKKLDYSIIPMVDSAPSDGRRAYAGMTGKDGFETRPYCFILEFILESTIYSIA